MEKSILAERSLLFAIRIVKTYQHLCTKKKEFVISKQLLRSGTAIGALIREAAHAESPADFVHKFAIAQKESNETLYWLELLQHTGYLTTLEYESLQTDTTELLKMLTASIKTMKAKR